MDAPNAEMILSISVYVADIVAGRYFPERYSSWSITSILNATVAEDTTIFVALHPRVKRKNNAVGIIATVIDVVSENKRNAAKITFQIIQIQVHSTTVFIFPRFPAILAPIIANKIEGIIATVESMVEIDIFPIIIPYLSLIHI